MKRYPEIGCIGEPVSWQSSKLTCLILLCKRQIAAKLNQKSNASLFLIISVDTSPNPDEASYFAYPKSLQRCNVIYPIHRANHIFPHLLPKNPGKFSCPLFLRQVINRILQEIGWLKLYHYFFSTYTIECLSEKLSHLKQTSKLPYDGPTVCAN